MRLTPGTRLSHYEIGAAIGAGGMGEVYKGRDTRLDRDVAIKVLPADWAGDRDRAQRFEQEARAASGLNHPNILTIHDVGREGDTMFIAMEWVDGHTLRRDLAAGRMPLRRVLDVAQQIAEGLAKAHAAGIVHRDLKPENVMLSRDGFAKIVDFGLAKVAHAPHTSDTQAVTVDAGTTPGVVLGTFGYMSPEQAGGGPVDYRSDQFALGLLIYEMSTGTQPFVRPTAAQSMAAAIEAHAEPIERLNPGVPAHLAAVVSRCLAKDPGERYESTRDLARDLKQIRETASGVAGPAVPGRRLIPVPLAIGALIAIAVAVAAVAWWSRREPPPAAATGAARPLVAVRALRNLSPDPAQGYFAAGLTEEIRGQLSQLSALRLLSQSAVNAYQDDVARMTRELGVGSLVEGSVRVEGERVRVTAELIDAATQQTLWSQQYERDLANVFAVQTDVALRIADALRANLTPAERSRVEQPPTQNTEAYRLYLEARQHSSGARAANLKGIELLQQALALDPSFAVARASLAGRMSFMAYYDDPSWLDKAIAEAQAALRDNPTLPAAHLALAASYTRKGRDADARMSFLRALELNPNASAYDFSIHESTFGRFEEALHWARRAFGLSAKRGNDYYHVAVPLVPLGDSAVSRWWLAEAERRFPTFSRVQLMIAVLDTLEDRAGDAERRLEAALQRTPENEEIKLTLVDVVYLSGSAKLPALLEPILKVAPGNAGPFCPISMRLRQAHVADKRGDVREAAALADEAERAARARMEKGDESPDTRLEMAAVMALRRDEAAALDWLSRAYEANFRFYGLLELDPILAPLRTNPRFRELVDRIRRDVEAQRGRARERGLLELRPLIPPSP